MFVRHVMAEGRRFSGIARGIFELTEALIGGLHVNYCKIISCR